MNILLLVSCGHAAQVPTVKITPTVEMPMLSLGTCCGSEPGVGLLPWFQAGGRGIDTAWDYFDQKSVGKGIRASGLARSEIFVLTKVPPLLDVKKTVASDLEQLGLEYVDLLLLHNPTTKAENAKQWADLESALAQNLTRSIGISDFSLKQLEELLETATVKPALLQADMSIGHHDDATIEFCAAHNITYEAWNVMKGCNRSEPAVIEAASNHNVSTFQICQRYIVDRGCILTVGTGSDPKTVGSFAKENIEIFNFQLTAEEVKALSAI